ncbi:hypothetical protein BH09MYX1_BH09MYX1_13460 [soil metagenome]
MISASACGGKLATTDSAGSDAGVSAQCNALELLSDTVTVSDHASASAYHTPITQPPEGTYVLLGSTRFTGSGPSGDHGTLSLTVEVTPDGWQVARSDDGGPVQRSTHTLDRLPDGRYFERGVCGATDIVVVSFAAITGTGFAFDIVDEATGFVSVYQFRKIEK